MPESLLQQVASGNMSVMQTCIDTYSGLVWSLARRLCGNPLDAEDAVQEAFIALWENADRFDPEKGSEVTFVSMIARRRIIDRGRKSDRRRRTTEAFMADTPAESLHAMPADAADQDDEVARVRAALERISPDQRRVLQLTIHGGYSQDQVSAITEMPLGTVKTHARRGLIKIREMLAQSEATQGVSDE